MYTDHNNLRWLLDAKWSSGKLARWALRLTEYDMEIKHTKGTLNAAADALSRYPLYGRPCALHADSCVPPAYSVQRKKVMCMSDRLLADGGGYVCWPALEVQQETTVWDDTYCKLFSDPLGLVSVALSKETCHDVFHEVSV